MPANMALQPPNPRYYTAEHEAFRASVRRFFDKEVAPHAEAWDEAGGFPRELYRKAAEAGLLQPGFPEAYGGAPCDAFYRMILFEERAWGGSGGIASGLFSHTIGAPPIAAVGSEAMKARVLPQILSGEKISALAITEPGAGSDVAHLTTAARREGDHYVVNGTKLYITSGMRADFFTVAVRTGGPGAGGVSLLLIEGDTPGLSRTLLKKMGWWASDTAEIVFDNCRVPVENLIGEAGKGFAAITKNFNHDAWHWRPRPAAMRRCASTTHLHGHASATPSASGWPTTRWCATSLSTWLRASKPRVRCWTTLRAGSMMAPHRSHRSPCEEHGHAHVPVLRRPRVQLLGGMGYMRGSRAERLYREVKVMMIGGGGGGDLAARQLGI